MHIILNDRGQVAALGGRDIVPGPDQTLVTVLDTEVARVQNTAAALPQAGQEFVAAFQSRASATARADLPTIDSSLHTAARALTTAQLDAAQAEDAYTSAEIALRDAMQTADREAVAQHGEFGVLLWDAAGKRFVAALDEQRQAEAAARQEEERQAEEQRQKKLARIRERAAADPDFALLAELAGVDLG